MQALPCVVSIVALLHSAAGAAERIKDSGVDYMPGWIDTPVAPDPVCQRPNQGAFQGSCGTLLTEERQQGRPKHLGDIWVACEEPKHGSVGYGAAVFFHEEVAPYWAEEIDSYLGQIKRHATAEVADRIFTTHDDWLKRRNDLRNELASQYAAQEGTLAGYMVEHGFADIDRSEALRLGCALEELMSP